jgi:hypothetical protein
VVRPSPTALLCSGEQGNPWLIAKVNSVLEYKTLEKQCLVKYSLSRTGLKVQAFANNKTRERLDMYDIETLMSIHGVTLDWDLIGEYFSLFESSALFAELKRKYCDN